MDPEQVGRDEDGVMRCRQCGFPYALSRREVLERAETGLHAVEAAVAAVPERHRRQRPVPEVWSVNAYTSHLADAAQVIASRVWAISEEDRPPLPYHDQDQAVEESHADDRPADESLDRLRVTVETYRRYLEALPPDAWTRVGIHALAGEVQLAEIAHDMPHELEHHAQDIQRVGAEIQSRSL